MTYAPHSNTDVHHQLLAGRIPTPLGLLLGSFKNKETDAFFEYGERRWHDEDFAAELPHMIYTIDGPRLAKVLKTVAHVLTGEGVVEVWAIRSHREYPTDWVKGA
jgi:hypothetical protein